MTSLTAEYSILVVDDDPDIVLGLQDYLDHRERILNDEGAV